MWGQNSWAGNHWLCLHRRNRKCPQSLTCWNYRSSQISLLLHTNPNLVTDRALCKWDTQAHPAVPAVPASPPGATTKPGLFWQLRADTKPWAAICSHLSSPALSRVSHSLWSCAVPMVILCPIHQHGVTEVSSALTGSQKKVKTSFNRLLPVICYIKNGITLHSFMLGIHHSTKPETPDRAPGWYGPEPTKTNTTFSRS